MSQLLRVILLFALITTPSAYARHKAKGHKKQAQQVAAPEPTFTSVAPAAGSVDEPIGWEKMGESDGITTYKKEIAGDPVVALRGEGLVDASILTVASVVLDDSRAAEWVDSLVSAKRVKTYNDRAALTYTHIGTPFILKDRDFLTRAEVEGNLREKTLTLRLRSVEDPVMPPGKPVRGELQGYWKLRSMEGDKKTYVIAEMHADPRGSVPKWIVNLFQRGWARGTMEHLRKQVGKSDIKVIPEVAKAFELPGGLK